MFKIQDLRQNLTSGILVSFIALPLCIAISIASGFPVLAGIITAIIGGMIVSQISGSYVTINGPAAGMIVVIMDSVRSLGGDDLIMGYKLTLGAILIASIMQVVFSFTKLPELMRKFPEIVIRGMMTAIGLIVILKQIFTMFGYKIPKEGMIKLITDVPFALLGAQYETIFIGIFTIVLILVWNKKLIKIKYLKSIPVYLVAILVGSLLAYLLNIEQNKHFVMQGLSVSPSSLFLKLPDSFTQAFSLPMFSKLDWHFTLAVITIFAVGSLETILSAIATDKLDLLKRKTNLKKDLRAVGFGNAICGAIGGLPMIAEIVRSSANIKYGATNKWSNFFHGLSLLILTCICGSVLQFVPLCVLAAMLILIGYNLINLPLLFSLYKESKFNIVIIASVVFFTLYIDLLIGIGSGFVLHYAYGKILKYSKKYYLC
jgi:MFS superfamily sulfate permease-like transporter